MKNISIIIPIFNGEQYLEKICNQLANQTYQKFEVIFIDDCSTDNSYKILLKMGKYYDFITIIKNETNKGAGYSRNIAIKKAKYDYIGFLDCDDEIPPNYFEELSKSLFENKADMVLCDVKISYEDGFNLPDFYNITCHELPVDKKDIIHNDIVAGAWNKIIKKGILLNNPFSEGIINEDIPAIIGAIMDARKIVYTNKTYYTYIQRKNSVQNGTKLIKKFDVFNAVDELIERKKGRKELEENLSAIIYHQIILFLFFGIISQKNIKQKSKYLKLFEEKSKKYNIRSNKYYWQFISNQGKKYKYYYKIILKLMDLHFYKLSSLVIIIGNKGAKIKNIFKKKIVKSNITIEDLIKVAKRNQQREEIVSVSVIVPNYNYEKFLSQRIYSILYQNYKVSEIIILDDYSKDNSIKLIEQIKENLKEYIEIQTYYNKKNSGSPFKQWAKGIALAKSEYIWIAEADDYSSNKFLKTVLKPIMKKNNIILSYCDTSYINANGITITKTVKDLIDIMASGHWDTDFINDGENEIKNYAFLNCTIANVSSVIFKNNNYKKELEKAGTFKQCGDWYFYYSLMKQGNIAYSTKTLNYCRLHGNNSTTNMQKKVHYEEIKKIQNEIINNYSVRKDAKYHIKKRLDYLKEVWDITDID